MSDQTIKKKRNPIWIFLALTFLAANGVQAYFYYETNERSKEKSLQIEDQTEEILLHKADIDNLKGEIQIKVDSLTALGQDVTKLENLQIELNQMVKQLKNKNYNLKRSKRQLSSKLKGYETLLKLKDEQITSLSATVTAQGDLIQEKNQVIIRKELDIEDLKKIEAKQTDIINEAKVLKVGQLKVVGVKNGKVKEKSVYKAKELIDMQVSFRLLENKVAQVETKEVFVQIKDPSGSTIYDLATGGGEFTVDGNIRYYTKKLEVLYERKGKSVIFSYSASNPYKSGKNSITVYTEDNLIGEGSFQVK
jgi:hypothetical protein